MRQPPHDDIRAYALNAASVALLTELQVWDRLPADARTPVYDMRIEGDARGAALTFSAWQQRVGELAWIVDAAALLAELAAAVREAPRVQVTREPVEATLLGARRRPRLGGARCARRRLRHPQLWPAARSPRGWSRTAEHQGVARQMVPCARRARAAAVRSAAACGVRTRWCGRCPMSAHGRCSTPMLPISRRSWRGHRRRRRHPDLGQRRRGWPLALARATPVCGRGLGAARRCRACGASAGRAGAESRPGRRRRAGPSARRTRAMALAGR